MASIVSLALMIQWPSRTRQKVYEIMFKPDSFPKIDVPKLPKRTPVDQHYSIDELKLLRSFPSLKPTSDNDFLELTVAYPNSSDSQIPVLFIDTLTHFHRNRLDHYVLERFVPFDEDGETTWHIGTIEIPKGMTSMVGIINIPQEAFSNGQQPGKDRQAYKTLLKEIEPAWTDGEILKVGTGRLNPLQAAGSAHTGTTHRLLEETPEAKQLHYKQFPEILDKGLDGWLHLPETQIIKDVLIVTDGRVYAEGVKLLNQFEATDTAVLFVAPSDDEQRANLLGELDILVTALQEYLLPWATSVATQQNKTWPETAEARTITGGSLGGYAAAGLVLKHPEIAHNAIIQSAAFWWPDNDYGLLNEWERHTETPDGLKRIIFHEYGKYDVHLSSENTKFGEILGRLKDTVNATREYNGGHDYLSWRQGITEGHQWIRAQLK